MLAAVCGAMASSSEEASLCDDVRYVKQLQRCGETLWDNMPQSVKDPPKGEKQKRFDFAVHVASHGCFPLHCYESIAPVPFGRTRPLLLLGRWPSVISCKASSPLHVGKRKCPS